MTFKDITHESHLEKDIENIKQISSGIKTSYKTEKLYKKKNGEIIWGSIVVTAIRDDKNELEFYIGMILDITERKKNEKNMELLKLSIEISLDGAFWMNKKGQFVYVNDAACKSLGYTKEQLMQLTIFDVNTNITSDNWEEFWSYLRENKMIKSETVHKRKDGSLFPVEISSVYIKVLDEEYCNGFARDISSRNDIYDALKESEARYRLITEMTTDYFVKLGVSEQNAITLVYT
jgi:PAS domain S-box-containing protein